MGFFSFQTADTKQSIMCVHSSNFTKLPVYLLQPEGKESIVEPAYQGYGVFGGVDAYEWVALNNAGIGDRGLGCFLSFDTVVKVVTAEKTYHFSMFSGDDEVMEYLNKHICNYTLVQNYATPIECMKGKNLNELIRSGEGLEVSVNSIVDLTYPLKFSFLSSAIYEDLPASRDCPNQGFF